MNQRRPSHRFCFFISACLLLAILLQDSTVSAAFDREKTNCSRPGQNEILGGDLPFPFVVVEFPAQGRWITSLEKHPEVHLILEREAGRDRDYLKASLIANNRLQALAWLKKQPNNIYVGRLIKRNGQSISLAVAAARSQCDQRTSLVAKIGKEFTQLQLSP